MDLFALVADKNIQYALDGALTRPQALGIRAVSSLIKVHAGRDGGSRTTGADILALERQQHEAFLLIFDFEGSGSDAGSALVLEEQLDQELAAKVGPNAKAIVIEPEADVWVWGSDNALAEVFEWPLAIGIRDWLRNKGHEFDGADKPIRPKEALEALIPVHKKPRSSALYKKITSRISLARCHDPAYLRLRNTLRAWFPQ
jgi:hypothetical protein